MKQLTFKQCIVLLRTCILLLVLCMVSVFIFLVTRNNKAVENSDHQKNSAMQSQAISIAEIREQSAITAPICKNNNPVVSLLPATLSEQFMQ